MFTTIEGEWDEVFDVIRRATDAAAYGPRVDLVLKADIRPGYSGEVNGKVERLEQAIVDQGQVQFALRKRQLARSCRSTYCRIPPWRKYPASAGVSMRASASNCRC